MNKRHPNGQLKPLKKRLTQAKRIKRLERILLRREVE